MSGQDKTHEELLCELAEARRRLARLEAANAALKEKRSGPGRAAGWSPGEQEAYRNLVEQMRDVPYSATAEGIVTYIGPQAARYGLSPAEVISRNFLDFVAPADRERIAEAFQKLISTGEQSPTEFRFQAESGETYWFEEMSSLQYDDRGKVKGVLGILRDVSERRRTLDALKASEETLTTISDSVLDAVVMIDDAGNVRHWNPAAERIFGYRPEEIMGRDAHDILATFRHREAARKGFAQFAETGTEYAVGKVMELEATKKDGTEFPIEIAVSPIRLGGRWWASAVIRDITERKKAEEALRREDERLRRLLEMYERDHRLVAYEIHDGLTQPLIAALMHIEAILKTGGNDLPQDAHNDCEKIVGLIRRSIEEARRMMGGLRPAILDVMGLRAAIEHVIYENEREGSPTIEYLEDVTFDRLAAPLETAVFRIVQEGLSNAVRHSKSERVQVSLSQQDQRIRVRIEDWGTGFEPATIAENRYGLEGIRMRAQLFGGETTIDSAPGEGTRILVELPLIQPASPLSPAGGDGDEAAE